jgi:hypothetical protein
MPLMGGGVLLSGSLAAINGTSRAPQLLQNTLSSGFAAEHIGQTTPETVCKRAPQLLQNLLVSRLAVPQAPQ